MLELVFVIFVATAGLLVVALFCVARLSRALEERQNATSKENWVFAIGFASILVAIVCVAILFMITVPRM